MSTQVAQSLGYTRARGWAGKQLHIFPEYAMRAPRFRIITLGFIVIIVSQALALVAQHRSAAKREGALKADLTQLAQKSDGRDWISSPPDANYYDFLNDEISAEDIYEIVASKNYVPIYGKLKSTTHVELTPDLAKYFAGQSYNCPSGKTPYLIRAVYGHGGTGGYLVYRMGRKILVVHGSLGQISVSHKSAIIVNLDFEPELIYSTVSIAE